MKNKKKDVRLSPWPASLVEKIDRIAVEEHRSRSKMIEMMCLKYVRHRELQDETERDD